MSILMVSCGSAGTGKHGADAAAKGLQNTSVEAEDSNTAKIIYVAWPETFAQLPAIKLDALPEAAYPKTPAKSHLTQAKPEYRDDYLYIPTDEKPYRHLALRERGGDTGWSGAELQGYYPVMNLYAIAEHSSAEGLGFCNLLLLDRHSSYRYYINSIGDDCVSLPLPSPDGQFMVYYYNWPYEHSHSDLVVLKYNEAAEPEKRFSAYAYLKSETFAIESIVWQDARHFYIRGYEEHLENEKWIRRYSYYEADIP